MQARVLIGAAELDPFRVGYDVSYYELSLEAEAHALLASPPAR